MTCYGKNFVGPDGKPLPLSSAISVGDFVFLSGQLGLRQGKLENTIEEQTEAAFDEIARILSEVNLSLDHIIKATVWLTEAGDFAAFNNIYRARFRAPYPPRSCVVSQLVIPGARVEIEVVASRAQTRI